MKFFIKYMQHSLQTTVQGELKKLGFRQFQISLGEVEMQEDMSDRQFGKLKKSLAKFKLEVVDDRKTILVEKIKNVVADMICNSEGSDIQKAKFSTYLSEKLNYDYSYLANLFSEIEGDTIAHYVMIHKIERVKELLMYDELSLTEIAYQLHYSSVSYLSSQFKRVTGLTPSHYKSLSK